MSTISHYSDLCVISYRKQLLCREQELKKKLQVSPSTSASSPTPLPRVPTPSSVTATRSESPSSNPFHPDHTASHSSSSAGNPDAWASQTDIDPNVWDIKEDDDLLFDHPCLPGDEEDCSLPPASPPLSVPARPGSSSHQAEFSSSHVPASPAPHPGNPSRPPAATVARASSSSSHSRQLPSSVDRRADNAAEFRGSYAHTQEMMKVFTQVC